MEQKGSCSQRYISLSRRYRYLHLYVHPQHKQQRLQTEHQQLQTVHQQLGIIVIVIIDIFFFFLRMAFSPSTMLATRPLHASIVPSSPSLRWFPEWKETLKLRRFETGPLTSHDGDGCFLSSFLPFAPSSLFLLPFSPSFFSFREKIWLDWPDYRLPSQVSTNKQSKTKQQTPQFQKICKLKFA